MASICLVFKWLDCPDFEWFIQLRLFLNINTNCIYAHACRIRISPVIVRTYLNSMNMLYVCTLSVASINYSFIYCDLNNGLKVRFFSGHGLNNGLVKVRNLNGFVIQMIPNVHANITQLGGFRL